MPMIARSVMNLYRMPFERFCTVRLPYAPDGSDLLTFLMRSAKARKAGNVTSRIADIKRRIKVQPEEAMHCVDLAAYPVVVQVSRT